MRSNILKNIIAAIAASIIVITGAGCSHIETNSPENSTVSVKSSQYESEEYKTGSTKESSTESEKETSTKEYKIESAEESKTEFAEESGTVTSEYGNREYADKNSDTSEIDLSGYAAFFGSWEHDEDGDYYAFEINDDGSAAYRFANGDSVSAWWTVEKGQLCLRAAGGLETFDYVDGILIDTEYNREYIKVEILHFDTEAEDGVESTDNDYVNYLGSWEYEVGSMYFAFEISSEGTAAYRTTDGESLPARWNIEKGKLCLRAAGGLETFEYVNGTLKDTETGRIYLKVDTLSIDR